MAARVAAKKKKQVKAIVRFHLEAGKATPAPPVATLSQHKVKNVMAFCKEFNDKTKGMESGLKLPVIVKVYVDGTIEYHITKPTVSHMLRKAAGIKSGSSNPGRDEPVASLSRDQIMSIAKDKFDDLSTISLETAFKIIEGSARSIGIRVE